MTMTCDSFVRNQFVYASLPLKSQTVVNHRANLGDPLRFNAHVVVCDVIQNFE